MAYLLKWNPWSILLWGCPRAAPILYRIFCFSRVAYWDIQNRREQLFHGNPLVEHTGHLWERNLIWKAKFLFDLEWGRVKAYYQSEKSES